MLKQNERLVIFTVTMVVLLVISMFLPASAQLSQWRSLNPYRDGTLPIGGVGGTTAPPFLYSVHLLSPNYGWAVGGDCDIYTLPLDELAGGFDPACQSLPGKGFALFYDGVKWRDVLVPGATGTLTAVFGVSTTDVWAVGLGPTIIHWDGIAWTLVPAPATTGNLFGLFMLPSGTDGWAVGDGTVDNIRWSGSFPTGAWSAGPDPKLGAGDATLRAVSLSSPTFGWIVASDGSIFKWDGAGWLDQFSPVADVDLLSVDAVSSTDAWAVGADSTIIRWNGASWTGPMVAPTVEIDYRSIKMVSASDGWIVGELNPVTVEGILLRWNGFAWSIVRSWITQDLNGLFMLPGGTTGSAVGDAETIIKWTNVQWISQTSPTAFPLFDVHMVSTHDGWAVGGPFIGSEASADLTAYGYGGSGMSVSSSPIIAAGYSPMKTSTTIVLSPIPGSLTAGATYSWMGHVDPNPGSGIVVYLRYRSTSGTCPAGMSSHPLATTTTDSLGFFHSTFTAPGAGSWLIYARFFGDSDYAASDSSPCQSVTVSPAAEKRNPTIATFVHNSLHADITGSSVAFGTTVHDSATVLGVAGIPAPTGTVTFYFYTVVGGYCSSILPPASGEEVALGTESSPRTPDAGTYGYQATYNGDERYNPVTSDCEPFTVNPMPSPSMMGSSIFRWTSSSIHHWFHYETLPSPNTLLGVFMLNANDGWIVGSAANPSSPPVILHWDGVAWVVKTPPGIALGGTLMDVHALSPTEAWAVGFGPDFGATSAPPIVKWDGTIWASVPSGLTSGVLTDLHMVSSADGWAVGCTNIGCGPDTAVILRWNGLAWSSVTAPLDIAGLLDVFMLSPTDGWAVGNVAADGKGTIIHWDGVQWRRVPAPTGAFLTSVHMVGATEGWTVGFDTVSDLSLIVHWNGLTWDVVSTPPVPPTMTNILTSVFMVSAFDGWAVSGFTTAPNSPGFGAGSGLFIHYGPEVVPETTTSTSVVTETSTTTSVTTTSTVTCVTCTVPPGPGIPGFPIESVLAGLIAGVAVLAVLRHRPGRRH